MNIGATEIFVSAAGVKDHAVLQGKRLFPIILFLCTLLWSPAARGQCPDTAGRICTYTYRVVQSFPHDPRAFTQGLAIADGMLFEGTGLNGRSSLRRVELATGVVVQSSVLPGQFFGEGITVFGNRIIQLTWKSGFGFVYARDSFSLLRVFSYPAEGWGITHDGRQLIASDGTATLRFLDPDTFEVTRRLEVRDDKGPVPMLNELEYVDGDIYANVWQTDRIAIINGRTGRVKGWINLQGLLNKEEYSGRVDVLNGIAYDSLQHKLYVTGKLWPRLFQIEMVRTDNQ